MPKNETDLLAKSEDHFETSVLTACADGTMTPQVFESLKNMRAIIEQLLNGELTKNARVYPKNPTRLPKSA